MSYLDLKEVECPSKSIFDGMSDDDLFGELHACCNPNCPTIAEVHRRYNKKKEELIARYESAKAQLNDYSEI